MRKEVLKKKYRVWYKKPDMKYGKFTKADVAVVEANSGKQAKDIFIKQHPELKVSSAVLISY